MTDQVKRGLNLLCWILIVIAFAVGFYVGTKYEGRKIETMMVQPTGDCVEPDTVSVRESGVTLERCQAVCPECLWIARGAQ